MGANAPAVARTANAHAVQIANVNVAKMDADVISKHVQDLL